MSRHKCQAQQSHMRWAQNWQFKAKAKPCTHLSPYLLTTLDPQLHWGWWMLVPTSRKSDGTALPKTGWVPGISTDALFAPASLGPCAWEWCTHGVLRETGLSHSPHTPNSGKASQTQFTGNPQTQLSPLFICQWDDGFLFFKKCRSWNSHCWV